MRVVLLGKPGSGKGTQAKRISHSLGIPAISTGELMRRAIAHGTELGLRFKEFTEKGLLVPDALVLSLVEQRLRQSDCEDGFILDGFPRTIPQAEAFEIILAAAGKPLDIALNINVPDSALIERSEGRRFCSTDGTSYHVLFAPPVKAGICDTCGAILKQRDDDKKDVVLQRIAEYRAKTAPLVDFYRARSILRDIDGLGTPVDVASLIEVALRLYVHG